MWKLQIHLLETKHTNVVNTSHYSISSEYLLIPEGNTNMDYEAVKTVKDSRIVYEVYSTAKLKAASMGGFVFAFFFVIFRKFSFFRMGFQMKEFTFGMTS